MNLNLQDLIRLYSNGENPDRLFQEYSKGFQNLQQMGNIYQNMLKGRNSKEFIMQFARQQGLSEVEINKLQSMLNIIR